MLRRSWCLAVLMTLILSLSIVGSQTQNGGETRPQLPQSKEIAITIDDLPLNGPQFEARRLEVMTGKILAAIKQHRVPAVGFVNEALLYLTGQTDARIAILKSWSDAGVELGNHTFSHLGFTHASLAEYEDDFIRGDAVTRMLMRQKGQKPRYFRHPFLQMGATAELERSFEKFIAERGYRAAPVTIDILDWMILSAFNRARKQGDAEELRRVSDEYLKFAAHKFDFCEQVTAEMFGRPIKHILLLHANELNGDNLESLFRMLEERGYRFITLEEALKDTVYQSPDQYQPTSDWLSHWSASKGKRLDAPMPPDFIQNAYRDNQD